MLGKFYATFFSWQRHVRSVDCKNTEVSVVEVATLQPIVRYTLRNRSFQLRFGKRFERNMAMCDKI